jgi:hypothetical protein
MQPLTPPIHSGTVMKGAPQTQLPLILREMRGVSGGSSEAVEAATSPSPIGIIHSFLQATFVAPRWQSQQLRHDRLPS